MSRPDNFPDALAASSVGGLLKAPLYLAASTTSLGTTATQGIVSYPYPYTVGTLLGGPDALSAAVADAGRGGCIASQP